MDNRQSEDNCDGELRDRKEAAVGEIWLHGRTWKAEKPMGRRATSAIYSNKFNICILCIFC